MGMTIGGEKNPGGLLARHVVAPHLYGHATGLHIIDLLVPQIQNQQIARLSPNTTPAGCPRSIGLLTLFAVPQSCFATTHLH